jgi:anti-sigma-K factor RskA
MTNGKLTDLARAATSLAMQGESKARRFARVAAVALVPLVMAGCVTVNAPEEPIVIELNVNIRQEVIYRLAEDAGNTIEENADIF